MEGKVKLDEITTRKKPKAKKGRSSKKPPLRPITCSTGEIVQTYDKYLKTNHWKSLRKTIAERDKYTCQLCKGIFKSKFNIHHLTYKRIGHELLTDLIFYCEICHSIAHGSKKAPPIIPRKTREEELRKIISRLEDNQVEELIQYATRKYPQIRTTAKVHSKKKVAERTAIQIMNNVKLPV